MNTLHQYFCMCMQLRVWEDCQWQEKASVLENQANSIYRHPAEVLRGGRVIDCHMDFICLWSLKLILHPPASFCLWSFRKTGAINVISVRGLLRYSHTIHRWPISVVFLNSFKDGSDKMRLTHLFHWRVHFILSSWMSEPTSLSQNKNAGRLNQSQRCSAGSCSSVKTRLLCL